ncbi:MAG: hypothetical protein AB7S50_14195 [Bacteroidales bacterium]
MAKTMLIKTQYAFYIALVILIMHSRVACGQTVPYSTNNNYLNVWNGTQYVPFFVKGTNLDVSVPGTFPGELAATRSDYSKWFTQIKEAGFNCIRIYTLHYPGFTKCSTLSI